MKEKIIDRIRRLLVQSEGERTINNLGAAESYAAKATELLTKHKLELSDIDFNKLTDSDPLGTQIVYAFEWEGVEFSHRVEWTEDLADIISRANFCRALVFSESNAVGFVGRKSDVEITRFIFITVLRSALRICEVELAGLRIKALEPPPPPPIDPFDALFPRSNFHDFINQFNQEISIPPPPITISGDDFRYNFFLGFNQTLRKRLENQRKQLEQTSTALVRVEKDVDDFVGSMDLKDIPLEKQRRELSRYAMEKGINHGYGVNLDGNGLTENKSKELK